MLINLKNFLCDYKIIIEQGNNLLYKYWILNNKISQKNRLILNKFLFKSDNLIREKRNIYLENKVFFSSCILKVNHSF
tara:strand:+ start:90 stop:323 length:234 start_codon:yes stop_codon:yes gene_type:complete